MMELTKEVKALLLNTAKDLNMNKFRLTKWPDFVRILVISLIGSTGRCTTIASLLTTGSKTESGTLLKAGPEAIRTRVHLVVQPVGGQACHRWEPIYAALGSLPWAQSRYPSPGEP